MSLRAFTTGLLQIRIYCSLHSYLSGLLVDEAFIESRMFAFLYLSLNLASILSVLNFKRSGRSLI